MSRKYLSNRLEELISIFQPDLVESYDWSGPLWKKPSVPLVVRIHGANSAHQFFEKKRLSKTLSFFEKRNLRMADHLCAVSHHMGQITIAAFDLDRSFSTIYNFVDTKKFKPLPKVNRDPNRLLYVGRIHARKGLLELFNIIKHLFVLQPNLYIDLVGPSYPAFQTELLRLLPASDHIRVTFLGRVPHEKLPQHYNQAALFLMPSRAEAFGLTAIEAMACGTTVVLTDRASGPEIIEDANEGLLINIDQPQEAANKINALLLQPRKLEEMGRRGLEKARTHFALSQIVKRNFEFYRDCIT